MNGQMDKDKFKCHPLKWDQGPDFLDERFLLTLILKFFKFLMFMKKTNTNHFQKIYVEFSSCRISVTSVSTGILQQDS